MSDYSNDAPSSLEEDDASISRPTKIESIENVEREAFGSESSRSLLAGPKKPNYQTKGRLNRLHAVYTATPTEDNLNTLLTEVERYARHVTVGRGGALSQQLHQSAVEQYSTTDLSQLVTIKVWAHLKDFKGNCSFSSWVYRVAQNTLKDMVKKIIHNVECPFIETNVKDRDGEYYTAETYIPIANSTGESYWEQLSREQDWRYVALMAAVETLCSEDQGIFHLMWQGYNYREISQKYGKNDKWGANKVFKVKKLLKMWVAKYNKPSAESK